MRTVPASRIARFAFLVSGTLLLLGGTAMAQTVPVFDDAPSIEQLRSIMIPQSQPGIARSIVLPHPNQPSGSVHQASTKVLPAVKSDPAADAGVVAFHVNFALNSAALPGSAAAMIDLIAQLMKEEPELKVRVEGHTDASGSFDYNKALSERRALSVAEYLVRQGVEPSRLVLTGKGPTEPLTQNRYDPANRRVQFVRVS